MIGQENIGNTKYDTEHEGLLEVLKNYYILKGY